MLSFYASYDEDFTAERYRREGPDGKHGKYHVLSHVPEAHVMQMPQKHLTLLIPRYGLVHNFENLAQKDRGDQHHSKSKHGRRASTERRSSHTQEVAAAEISSGRCRSTAAAAEPTSVPEISTRVSQLPGGVWRRGSAASPSPGDAPAAAEPSATPSVAEGRPSSDSADEPIVDEPSVMRKLYRRMTGSNVEIVDVEGLQWLHSSHVQRDGR